MLSAYHKRKSWMVKPDPSKYKGDDWRLYENDYNIDKKDNSQLNISPSSM